MLTETLINPVARDTVAEGVARDTQGLGGLHLVTVEVLQATGYHRPLKGGLKEVKYLTR